MRSAKWLGLVAAALMGISTGALAEEVAVQTDDQTKAEKAEKKEVEKQLKEVNFLPYKLLTSLTGEQKEQIVAIHKKYLDQKKELEQQETAELDALLTPEQTAELKKLEGDRQAEKKAKSSERREKQKSQAKDYADSAKTDEKPAQ